MNNSPGANFSQGSNKGSLVANGSEHESLFLAPSLPCDFGHNISIHCLDKCGFFGMVLINQQMSCKHLLCAWYYSLPLLGVTKVQKR